MLVVRPTLVEAAEDSSGFRAAWDAPTLWNFLEEHAWMDGDECVLSRKTCRRIHPRPKDKLRELFPVVELLILMEEKMSPRGGRTCLQTHRWTSVKQH